MTPLLKNVLFTFSGAAHIVKQCEICYLARIWEHTVNHSGKGDMLKFKWDCKYITVELETVKLNLKVKFFRFANKTNRLEM